MAKKKSINEIKEEIIKMFKRENLTYAEAQKVLRLAGHDIGTSAKIKD